MGRFRDALKQEIQQSASNRHEARITLGGEEIVAYARPITGADMDFVCRKNKGFLENPTVGGMADLIIRKAQDEGGSLIFDQGDKPYLIKLGLKKIEAFYGDLFNIAPEGDEDDIETPLGDTDLSEEAVEREVKN